MKSSHERTQGTQKSIPSDETVLLYVFSAFFRGGIMTSTQPSPHRASSSPHRNGRSCARRKTAGDFVIVSFPGNSPTTGVKTTTLARFLTVTVGVCALTLLTGCFETKEEFTLNPDGSGKVTHECSFQEINLGGDNEPTEEKLKESIGKVLTESKGVEAWRDVSYKRLDDGRLYFKGTAYFTNLNALDIPNQTMLEFDWKRAGSEALLTLRTNKSDKQEGFKVEKKAVDWSKLTPEERTKKLKEERAKFQQAKMMMSAFMGSMKHDVVFHLPGKVAESSNFTKDASGALGLRFEGAKLLAAMDKLINDDAWAQKNLDSFDGTEKPMMDAELNALVFGSKAPVQAKISGGQPLFNYATEVAAAKKETESIRKKLGVGSAVVTIAPPAQGGALKGVKVVGVRLVADLGRKDKDFRPFNDDPGYTIVLQVDFPGSILAVTDNSSFETAVADDGMSLLPSSEWKRKIHWPKLSSDKASALLEAELSLPAPGVKGLKEISGRLEYQVASATKEVDLGFTELKENTKGTELGAQIKSIKDGWNKDGSQMLELKLNLKKESLKAVRLVVDGVKTELRQNGYGGGGNTYTFTYESKTAYPANGKLVAEVYDQMQLFETTFKLENISLLGVPVSGR